MKTNTSPSWGNLYELIMTYIDNQDMKMLSYQRETPQFFSNVQITYPNVEVNPLELFLLKKWATKVTIKSILPEIDLDFSRTGYEDIDNAYYKVNNIQSLLTEPQCLPYKEIDKSYQLPLYGIRYLVDAQFKGTQVFNILGTAPLITLDPRLRTNPTLFKAINNSRLVAQFLNEQFRKNFIHYQESYFNSPDIFTDAVVYQKYLRHCVSLPTQKLPQEFFIQISHIQYDNGVIHFLDTDKDILQAELDQYHSDLVNGKIDPSNNEYVILVTSSLKIFFGFFFYTNYVTAHENWLVTLGNSKTSQLFSKSFYPESIYHQTMVESMHSTMKFLLDENQRKEKENTTLLQLGKYEQQTLNGQIYSSLPGTSTMHYMLRIRGDEPVFGNGKSSTFTETDGRHPIEAYGYLDHSYVQQLAKLISSIEKSLNTV